MVVAIDATPLTISTGGIRSYTQNLINAFTPHDDIWLISDQALPTPPVMPANVNLWCGAETAIDRRWWSLGAHKRLKRIKADVFHGTGFAVPYWPACASVLTLYDLSPWKNSDWHHNAQRVRRRTQALLRLRIPTLIVTLTEAIRGEAIEYFHLMPDRVVTVPLASHLTRSEPYVHPKPYILFAGTIEPRKNLPTLIEAWRRIRQHHDVDLVVAGRTRADAPHITPAPGLNLLGEVNDALLASLYSGAVACAYPSLYEGFGLPPLEAMSCGCPAIISKDPALREVSQGAAIEVEALNVDQLSQALVQLITDPAERAARVRLGLRRATAFSWTATAGRMREVYVEAIRIAAK